VAVAAQTDRFFQPLGCSIRFWHSSGSFLILKNHARIDPQDLANLDMMLGRTKLLTNELEKGVIQGYCERSHPSPSFIYTTAGTTAS
jgi:hypothetical protein